VQRLRVCVSIQRRRVFVCAEAKGVCEYTEAECVCVYKCNQCTGQVCFYAGRLRMFYVQRLRLRVCRGCECLCVQMQRVYRLSVVL